MRLLVLGDSAAASVGAPLQQLGLGTQLATVLADDHEVQFLVHASTGATTRRTLRSLDRLHGSQFDVVVISLGVNDATGGVRSSRFARQQTELMQRLRQEFGARLIIASGLPPVHRFPLLPQPLRAFLGARARRLDNTLARLAAECGGFVHLPMSFSDNVDESAMAEDGFHPGPAMYEYWARAVAARIRNATELQVQCDEQPTEGAAA